MIEKKYKGERLLEIDNLHGGDCDVPPSIDAADKYVGYFENCYGEQWVFVYDPERKVGELRGGDIGWDSVVQVKDGRADLTLGKAEAAWLEACWKAATFAG